MPPEDSLAANVTAAAKAALTRACAARFGAPGDGITVRVCVCVRVC